MKSNLIKSISTHKVKPNFNTETLFDRTPISDQNNSGSPIDNFFEGGAAITYEAITAFCAGTALLITLYDHTRGYFEVEQQKWRYERGIKTV